MSHWRCLTSHFGTDGFHVSCEKHFMNKWMLNAWLRRWRALWSIFNEFSCESVIKSFDLFPTFCERVLINFLFPIHKVLTCNNVKSISFPTPTFKRFLFLARSTSWSINKCTVATEQVGNVIQLTKYYSQSINQIWFSICDLWTERASSIVS